MDPDGRNQTHLARGLRNAVGLRWIRGNLFATNMGSDHLGNEKPADTLYQIKDKANYGWPYCYQFGNKRYPDPKFNVGGKKMNCREVPPAYSAFDAHSSPLGLEYFDADSATELRDSFLVALHGSTKKSLNRGYRVVRLKGNLTNGTGSQTSGAIPEDWITGFRQGGIIYGRPADVFKLSANAFLVTDDYAGVIYYVYKK